MKKARQPQNVNNVPFKAVLPMKLRNHVSGKSDRQKLAPCIQELTVLFARLKEHEFNDELCAKETAALREANREYLTTRYENTARKISLVNLKAMYDNLDKYFLHGLHRPPCRSVFSLRRVSSCSTCDISI